MWLGAPWLVPVPPMPTSSLTGHGASCIGWPHSARNRAAGTGSPKFTGHCAARVGRSIGWRSRGEGRDGPTARTACKEKGQRRQKRRLDKRTHYWDSLQGLARRD